MHTDLLGEELWKLNEAKSGEGDRRSSSSGLEDTPSLCSLPPIPSPLSSSASGGGVYLEGDSKCIWPPLYLPRRVAIRLHCVILDCVTQSSSAQDRSVRLRTHAYPLPPTLYHDALRGARPRGAASTGIFTCANMSKSG